MLGSGNTKTQENGSGRFFTKLGDGLVQAHGRGLVIRARHAHARDRVDVAACRVRDIAQGARRSRWGSDVHAVDPRLERCLSEWMPFTDREIWNEYRIDSRLRTELIETINTDGEGHIRVDQQTDGEIWVRVANARKNPEALIDSSTGLKGPQVCFLNNNAVCDRI